MGENKEKGVLKGYTKEELEKGILTLDRSFEEETYKPKSGKESEKR